MEPLTHTFVGVALAETRLGGSTRLAGAALVIGANLPDVDMLSYFAGSDAGLGFRRGWTHGLPAVVVLPVLLTAVLLGYDFLRRRLAPGLPRARLGRLLLLSWIAVATHPALDWLNTYGIRLLMPFDGHWFYGDAVFVVDPWLWLLLGGSLFLGHRGGRLGLGLWVLLASFATVLVVGAGRVPPASKIVWLAGLVALGLLRVTAARRWRPEWLAWSGLSLSAVYAVAMVVLSISAAGVVRGQLERHGVADVEDLMVGPMPANPFRWDVVAETPEGYVHGSFAWLGGPSLALGPTRIDKPRSSPVVEAALHARSVRGALSWMRFPFVDVEETAEGYTVHILDARYLRRRVRRFGSAAVRLDRGLRAIPDREE